MKDHILARDLKDLKQKVDLLLYRLKSLELKIASEKGGWAVKEVEEYWKDKDAPLGKR